ncbi:MAG: DUF1501 domain-containing protein [Flavobacteriales bacterium]|nr:MAG: DUF1501 domain-containing protein [Flavobacteriales bacterium]
MDRRSFLRAGGAVTVGGMAVRGFSNPMLASLAKSNTEDRVLVVVQLYGGNDGLNTVIPIDQYSLLSQFRNNVLIDQADVLVLSGTGGATGLHPSMTGMKNLWDDGKLSIIQGVSYPDPNYSHFRATDIWETGSGSSTVLDSGWAGRYLNNEWPNYPNGFPNVDMPDPLAIRIGGPVGPALNHLGIPMAVAINNTQDPLSLVGNIYQDPITPDCKGAKLDFLRTVQRQADEYGDVIEAAAQSGCNLSTLYPTGIQPGAALGQALKIVAQLICGGLKTKIYWVSEQGFDTHAQQVNDNDHSIGVHANLLKGVSDAIHAFQDDLNLLGLEDRVLGMTFSEFGRRIMSNGSGGTDHGSALPMFMFGTQVLPGMLGTNPVIPANTGVNTNLAMQYDFRSVYASVLTDWFCLPPAEVDAILLNTYQPLAVVDPAGCLGVGIHEANQQAGTSVLDVYPNPFTDRTSVTFTTNGGRAMVQVYNEQGQVLATLKNETMPPGRYTIDCDLGPLPAGVYYCRLQNERVQQVKNMVKVR